MSDQLSPQCQEILKVLGPRYWVDAWWLGRVSLSFTRRIHELRAAGYEIELDDTWEGRKRRTRYRLVRLASAEGNAA
jgi:hypothetical protein